MIGDKDCLIDIKPCKSQNVTFGDGAKERIVGKEMLQKESILGITSWWAMKESTQ